MVIVLVACLDHGLLYGHAGDQVIFDKFQFAGSQLLLQIYRVRAHFLQKSIAKLSL